MHLTIAQIYLIFSTTEQLLIYKQKLVKLNKKLTNYVKRHAKKLIKKLCKIVKWDNKVASKVNLL